MSKEAHNCGCGHEHDNDELKNGCGCNHEEHNHNCECGCSEENESFVIDLEDENRELPESSYIKQIKAKLNDIISLVDVLFI